MEMNENEMAGIVDADDTLSLFQITPDWRRMQYRLMELCNSNVKRSFIHIYIYIYIFVYLFLMGNKLKINR